MDYSALVQQIVERVALKLAETEGAAVDKPGLLILTQQHGENCHQFLECTRLRECYQTRCALEADYQCDPADFEAVVLFDLTIEALGKLATGACDTPYTALAAKAILMGKKIFVPSEEIELCQYEATAPPAYYKKIKAQLNLLEASGLVICDLENLADSILTGDYPAPKPCCQEAKAAPGGEVSIGKKVITERDVTEASVARADAIRVCERAILTDLARELARSKGIRIIRG